MPPVHDITERIREVQATALEREQKHLRDSKEYEVVHEDVMNQLTHVFKSKYLRHLKNMIIRCNSITENTLLQHTCVTNGDIPA